MNTVHTLTVLKWVTELEDQAPSANLAEITSELTALRKALEFHLELPEGSAAKPQAKTRKTRRKR